MQSSKSSISCCHTGSCPDAGWPSQIRYCVCQGLVFQAHCTCDHGSNACIRNTLWRHAMQPIPLLVTIAVHLHSQIETSKWLSALPDCYCHAARDSDWLLSNTTKEQQGRVLLSRVTNTVDSKYDPPVKERAVHSDADDVNACHHGIHDRCGFGRSNARPPEARVICDETLHSCKVSVGNGIGSQCVEFEPPYQFNLSCRSERLCTYLEKQAVPKGTHFLILA